MFEGKCGAEKGIRSWHGKKEMEKGKGSRNVAWCRVWEDETKSLTCRRIKKQILSFSSVDLDLDDRISPRKDFLFLLLFRFRFLQIASVQIVWKRVAFVSIPSSSDSATLVTVYRLPGHWFLKILRMRCRQTSIACSLYFWIQQIFPFVSTDCKPLVKRLREKLIHCQERQEITMERSPGFLVVGSFLPVLLSLRCPDSSLSSSLLFHRLVRAFQLLLLTCRVIDGRQEHVKRKERR